MSERKGFRGCGGPIRTEFRQFVHPIPQRTDSLRRMSTAKEGNSSGVNDDPTVTSHKPVSGSIYSVSAQAKVNEWLALNLSVEVVTVSQQIVIQLKL